MMHLTHTRRHTMKTTKLISTLVAAAFALAITPAWAMEQDTGYPWFGELADNSRPAVSQSGKVVVTPVAPSGEDTGYPWYADTKEDHKVIEKPITIFKLNPNISDKDWVYPWLGMPKDHLKQDESVIR